MKEKIFNNRPLCLVFGFLLLGSIFSFYVCSKTIISIIVAIICFSLLLLLAIKTRVWKHFFVSLLAFTIGVSSYYFAYIVFTNIRNPIPAVVTARINTIKQNEYNSVMVYADSCIFDGKKVNDNIVIYVYDYSGVFENLDIGQNITFNSSKCSEISIIKDKDSLPNAKYYKDNIKYTMLVSIDNITFGGQNLSLAEKFKEKVKVNLLKIFSVENAEIAYSAMFGDKTGMTKDQYNMYKLSGVAHILAVSGLHITIVAGVLNLILRKMKVKKWHRFAMISVVLFFYAYICTFSYSILRACIMSIVLIASNNMPSRRYDTFSALGLAGIIIFFLNPFCVFDVGFLLSFSSVAGIVILYSPIKNMFDKMKLPPKIADSLAISTSVLIETAFVMSYFFGNINLVSLLANLIILPIFTICFVAIFIISVLSVILPFVVFLLTPVNWALNLINLFVYSLSTLPLGLLTTIQPPYISLVLYFLLLLFWGRMCTATKFDKMKITIPTLALLVIVLV